MGLVRGAGWDGTGVDGWDGVDAWDGMDREWVGWERCELAHGWFRFTAVGWAWDGEEWCGFGGMRGMAGVGIHIVWRCRVHTGYSILATGRGLGRGTGPQSPWGSLRNVKDSAALT